MRRATPGFGATKPQCITAKLSKLFVWLSNPAGSAQALLQRSLV
jgi:hypothetical protein